MSFAEPLIEYLKSKNVEYEVEGFISLEDVETGEFEVRGDWVVIKPGKEVPPDSIKLGHPCSDVRVKVYQGIPDIKSLKLMKDEYIEFFVSRDPEKGINVCLPSRFLKTKVVSKNGGMELQISLKDKKLEESLKKYLVALGFSKHRIGFGFLSYDDV